MGKKTRTGARHQDAFFPRDTRRSLPIALLRAREAVMEQFRPMLAAHGITEQQWRVVRLLAERGSLDASQVAEEAFILAPSLTRILRSLGQRGLIKRRKDVNDGRRTLLEITPAGLAILEEVVPESGQIYQALEKRYGREKLQKLLDMLDDLISK
ncbi:homoprotocatechuate degradation operon regulator HpaR [Microbacteriaceae bacterium K1510]|nr:homoprotocatechuate degradation operon regulator HpaR [Microbacteriaceae bacterium K1510]